MSLTRIILVGVSLLSVAIIANADDIQLGDTPVGTSGGSGGTQVPRWTVPAGSHIVGLNIWEGDRIDAIQIIYLDAQGHKQLGPKQGDPGGKLLKPITFGKGDFIGIIGRYGERVDSLHILTKDTGCGVVISERYGGTGGTAEFQYTARPGSEIVGFDMHKGDAIDALGIILGTRQ